MSNKDKDTDFIMFSLKSDKEIEDYLVAQEDSNDVQTKPNNEVEQTQKDLFSINEVLREDVNINSTKFNFTSNEQSSLALIPNHTDEKTKDEGITRKTFLQRTFGKIDAGSIRGSIFNMVILSIGSAILTLPQKMGQISLLLGLLEIGIFGVITYWTISLLLQVSEKKNTFSYSKLVKEIGGKILSCIIDWSILIYMFGILILYNVVSNFNL